MIVFAAKVSVRKIVVGVLAVGLVDRKSVV